MILEFIADLIEQDLLVGNNNYELFSLCTIIYDAVIVFWFQQIKYVHDAPLSKPDGYKPGEGWLCHDDPCFWIGVDTDKPPMCIVDVLY